MTGSPAHLNIRLKAKVTWAGLPVILGCLIEIVIFKKEHGRGFLSY
jgi:hypothetical protein